jgi:hypothetical protein
MLSQTITCLLVAGVLQVSAAQVERGGGKEARSYPMSVLRPVSFSYLIFADRLVSPDEPMLCRRNV